MLNSKQRAKLRGMAQHMDAIVHVGKDGITENIIKQTEEALEARELIKGSVQQNAPLSAKEACNLLAEQTGADGVSVLGRKFVLYRQSETKKTIEL
ncbi:MAG: ribosome assembly RNA-binding protein YhbY [Christensenellaceae bacterium]